MRLATTIPSVDFIFLKSNHGVATFTSSFSLCVVTGASCCGVRRYL